jgi:hypothetical protein
MVSIEPLGQPGRILPPNIDNGNSAAASRLDIEPRQGIVGPLDRVGLWQVTPRPAEPVESSAPITTGSVPPIAIASQLVDRHQTDIGASRGSRNSPAGSAFEPVGAAAWAWPMRLDGRLWPGFVLGALALLAFEGILGRWPSGDR